MNLIDGFLREFNNSYIDYTEEPLIKGMSPDCGVRITVTYNDCKVFSFINYFDIPEEIDSSFKKFKEDLDKVVSRIKIEIQSRMNEPNQIPDLQKYLRITRGVKEILIDKEDTLSSYFASEEKVKSKLYIDSILSKIDRNILLEFHQVHLEGVCSLITFLEEEIEYLQTLQGETKGSSNSLEVKKRRNHKDTVLTQKQTSLFFYLLREKAIINPVIEKVHYSEIIQQLTGYSKNTVRPDLSEIDLPLISENVDDYDVLICQLKILLESVEKAKKNLL